MKKNAITRVHRIQAIRRVQPIERVKPIEPLEIKNLAKTKPSIPFSCVLEQVFNERGLFLPVKWSDKKNHNSCSGSNF